MSRRNAPGRLRAIALGTALVAAVAAHAENRAEGGVGLLEALETAPAGVVGEVLDTRQLDRHGWAATLAVQTPLAGELARGAVVTLAWEELSPSRRARFAAGERILVALQPLPGASIWLARLPDPAVRAAALSPAHGGDAFLRNPSAASVGILEHYLALAPSARASGPGAGYLAELTARAETPLALSAVAHLREHGGLDAELGPASARLLVQALRRPDAALSDALVELVGSRRLESLRAPLEAAAGQDALAPAPVYAALARLDDGLSPQDTERLLATDASHRLVAARHAGGPDAANRLGRLIRVDPDAAVRSAAIERLVELDRRAAPSRVAAGLYDREPEVRGVAAQGLGSLGAAAVPELRRVAEGSDRDAAQAAVAGLMLTDSPEGSEALQWIAEHHPDEGIRALAGIALGRPIGHTH